MNKYLALLLAVLKASSSWTTHLSAEEEKAIKNMTVERLYEEERRKASETLAVHSRIKVLLENSSKAPGKNYSDNTKAYLNQLPFNIRLYVQYGPSELDKTLRGSFFQGTEEKEKFFQVYNSFQERLSENFASQEEVLAFRKEYEDFKKSSCNQDYLMSLNENEMKGFSNINYLFKNRLYFRLYCFLDSHISLANSLNLEDLVKTSKFLKEVTRWIVNDLAKDSTEVTQSQHIEKLYFDYCSKIIDALRVINKEKFSILEKQFTQRIKINKCLIILYNIQSILECWIQYENTFISQQNKKALLYLASVEKYIKAYEAKKEQLERNHNFISSFSSHAQPIPTKELKFYFSYLSHDDQVLLADSIINKETYENLKDLTATSTEAKKKFFELYDTFYDRLLKDFASQEEVLAFCREYEALSTSQTKQAYLESFNDQEKIDLNTIENLLRNTLCFRLYCFLYRNSSFEEQNLRTLLASSIFLKATTRWIDAELILATENHLKAIQFLYLNSLLNRYEKLYSSYKEFKTFSSIKDVNIVFLISENLKQTADRWFELSSYEYFKTIRGMVENLQETLKTCKTKLELEASTEILQEILKVKEGEDQPRPRKVSKRRKTKPLSKPVKLEKTEEPSRSSQQPTPSSVQNESVSTKKSKADRRRIAKLRKKEKEAREAAEKEAQLKNYSQEEISLKSSKIEPVSFVDIPETPLPNLPEASLSLDADLPLVPIASHNALVMSKISEPETKEKIAYKKEKVKTHKIANPEDSTKPWYRKVTQLPKIKVPSPLNPFKRILRPLTGNHRTTLESIFNPKKTAQKVTQKAAYNLLKNYGDVTITNVKGTHVQVDTTINGVSSHLTWSGASGYLKPAALKDLETLLENNGITPDASSSEEEANEVDN